MNSKITHLKYFLLISMSLVCGLCYGHGGDQEDTHAFEDSYLAEQARLKEGELPYLIDHWQQQLGERLVNLSNSLLPDLIKTATAAGGNPGTDGQWGAVTTWPFAFASASNLPDGRILAWGGNNRFTFTGGNFTYASIWNPADNTLKDVNHPTHSLFCGVPVMMENGRVFVPGGDKGSPSSVKATSTFNINPDAWTRIQDMNIGRWYDGTIYLPDGQVVAALGDPGSPYPEIWNPASGWSYLNGASLQGGVLSFPTITEPKNWLPHLHLAPNGQIFHSGHTPKMHYITTEDNGSVMEVGLTNDWNTANTPSVLFNEGKILKAGGALYAAGNPSTNRAAIIDLNSGIPSRTMLPNMQFARIFHNQVTLPNGEVLVIGGNTTGTKFSDGGSQLTPEIWNPVTQAWRPVAPHTIPRNYHSVALLMADGRVWSGGGGLCGCAADHPNSQVYSPPYLFNADGTPATRPQIISAPNVISYGQDINVTTTPGINKFSMVRMSGTTHALNSDMRYLNVPFTTVVDGTYRLSFHTNRNVMLPGYWMLFALNDQGVPSVAKIVRVSTTNSPVIDNIDTQSSIINSTVTLNVSASDPNGDTLTYAAAGLPTGLTISNTTGLISGKPKALGTFMTVVSVTDGTNEVSTKFIWNIVSSSATFPSPIYGGPAGVAFTDPVPADKRLVSINIAGGWYIDSIQSVLNSGPLPRRGGAGGTVRNVTWPANEYLVRIYGTVGTFVGRVSFVTNTGKVLGPYGTATNIGTPSNFDFTVPADNEIVGFTGRSGQFLNALGVIYRERQDSNQPPVVTIIGNQSTNVGEAVSLQVNATDPDGDAITFSATGLPAGLTISPSTGMISGTPTTQATSNVIISIVDSKGASAALNFTWTVKIAALVINQPSTTPQLVNTPVNLSASVANGINPRFKWSFGDGTPETAYSSSPTISHTYTVPNLHVVRLTVTDDTGATGTKTFIQAIHLPLTTAHPNASTNIAVSQLGTQLWIVNQDNDTVSVFHIADEAKRAETQVGQEPRALAQAPDGSFWVTNKQSGTISVINSASPFQVLRTIKLPYGSQPFGIVFAPNDSAAYVVLEADRKLLKLNPTTGAQLASVDVGPDPRHLSITADGTKVLVSRFITEPLPGEGTATVQTPAASGGEVVIVNTATMTVGNTVVLKHSDLEDNTITGSGIPNYLNVPIVSPDGLTVRVSSKQDNIKRGTLRNGNNINFQNTVRGVSSKFSLATLAELSNDRIDYDNTGLAGASVYSKTGNYIFVALEATRKVAIVDAYGDIVVGQINVGRAPDGLALSADGNTLFVNNFMDRTVSVVDLTDVFTRGDWAPPVVAQLSAVAQEKLSPAVLNGKQLFYDAKDPRLARDGYLSCAVCHNDGGHDGRVWDLTGLGEGLRNTIDLRGRSGTGHGLLHWSANFDEIQDFEGQIRGLAGGTGLMSDTDFAATSNTLGAPKAGKSADLDALAAYVNSLSRFAPSPYRNNDGSLTLEAAAGKALFTSAGCAQCHGGEPFSDSSSQANHNVGTIKATSGQRLGGALTGLDTPTLRDVWNTAPYLHDGSAPTLEAAISAHTAVPAVTALSAADIAKVAAYVKQIGDSEPAPANVPPGVAVTSPANGSVFLTTAGINLTANATDSDGIIVKVEFYAGSILIGTVNGAPPYNFIWRGAAAGSYAITAKAYDNLGATSVSAPVNITVNLDTVTTGTGLRGQYFNNLTLAGTPVLQRQEAVNFNWGTGSPGTGVRVDAFSVRWSGQIMAPTTGDYQFQTVTDDGVRLTVDGALVINDWTNHAATARTTSNIRLIGGQKYSITMDYYDNTGSASARLLWKAPGQAGFVVIPANRLF